MRADNFSNTLNFSVQDTSNEDNIYSQIHEIITSLFMSKYCRELREYILSVDIGKALDNKWDGILFNSIKRVVEEHNKREGIFSKYEKGELVKEAYSFVAQRLKQEGFEVTERTKKLCKDILGWEVKGKRKRDERSLGLDLEKDDEHTKHVGKKLREMSAAGDDRSLISHGEDRKYWYSVTDGFRLLVAIRKAMLHPIAITGKEEERHATHRENREKIFIADPYHSDNLNQYLRDDIARITGSHEIEEYNNDRWQSMPRVIVLPILYGLHWRSVRIEINYDNKESSILYDDPYGVGHFPKQEMERLLEVTKEQIRILLMTELKNKGVEVGNEEIEIKVKEYEKKIDQQGSYENSYDCGVIVFSNIRDYSRREVRNEVYAEALGNKTGIYSLSPITTNKHEEEIVRIRATHIRECREVARVEINTSKLEEIEERISQSSKNRVELLGGREGYLDEDLEECYGLLSKDAEEEINLDFIESYIGKEETDELGDIDFLTAEETLSQIEEIREEVNKLYKMEDIEGCLHKIKEGLKLFNTGINVGKYYEQEHELFLKLGDIYSKGENKLNYPKAVGIYRYVLNIIDRLPDKIKKEELRRAVENKIGLTEEKFIKQYSNDRQASEGDRSGANQNRAEEYKKNLITFREFVKGNLAQIEDMGIKEGEEELDEEGLERRAKEVEKIYGEIREYFIGDSGLIKQLLNDCIEELGGLPNVIDKRTGDRREVEYAAFGMGSMALGTMTPWSDMEWGIIIEAGLEREEESKIKEYFRNLTILMYIKVTNFGESLLTVFGIKELNNFKLSNSIDEEHNWFYDSISRRGFSFDGSQWHACKSPLGREKGFNKVILKEEGVSQIAKCKPFELICTMGELLKFQEEEIWWKEDKELVQALWNIVPILGTAKLVNIYQDNLKGYKEKIKEGSFEILKQDNLKLDPFSQVLEQDKEGQVLNVKKEIYRFPDRMGVALVGCLGNMGVNIWESIGSLYSQAVIANSKRHNELQLALSIATELRLRTYTYNDSQREDLSALAKHKLQIKELQEDITEEVFHIKEIRILYKYYYIAIPISLIIENTTNYITLINDLKKVNLCINNFRLRGYIFKRFLKYYEALEEFKKINYYESDRLKETVANLYYKIGDNLKAGKLYQEILSYRVYKYKGDHADIAGSLNSIGNISADLGNYKEALRYYFLSLWMRRRIYEGDHADIASSLTNIGNTLINLGNYEKALIYYLKSLCMRKGIYKKDHVDIASTLNDVGMVLDKIGDYNKALKYYTEAHIIMRKIYKGDYPKLDTWLNNIASVFSNLGKNNEALNHSKDSLSIREKLYKGDHYKIATSQGNIGTALFKLGKYKEALEYHKKSLEIQRRIYKGDHADIASFLNNIGNTLEGLYLYKDALVSHQQSLEMRRRIYKVDNTDIAQSLNNKGNVLWKLKEYRNALDCHRESLEIRRKLYKGDHPEIATSYNNIGSMLAELEEYREALVYHSLSLDMRRRIYEGDHADIAQSFNNIGAILYELNNYEKAYNHIFQAIEMLQNLNIINQDYLAYKNNLSKFRLRSANKEMLSYNDDQALGLYLSMGIEPNSLIGEIYNYANIFQETGNLNLAISCYEVLSERLIPQVRHIKHNLACMYHVKAIRFEESNKIEEYEEYLDKARRTFELALRMESEEPISSALYTKYAMFLVKHHVTNNQEEYIKIQELLNKASELQNDSSSLDYNQLEKLALVVPLQELLNRRDSINVTPNMLAYYLLIKIHVMHGKKEEAEEKLEELEGIRLSFKGAGNLLAQQQEEKVLVLYLTAYACKEIGYDNRANELFKKIEKLIQCEQELQIS